MTVDALGPGDQAAVLYTGQGPPQDFTADRMRLLRAVNAAAPSGDPSADAAEIEGAQIGQILEIANKLEKVVAGLLDHARIVDRRLDALENG